MAKTINVVIYVRGGVVQGASTDLADPDGVRIAIVDFDNGEGCSDEDRERFGVHQLDDGLASVGMEVAASDPEGVADIMLKANA